MWLYTGSKQRMLPLELGSGTRKTRSISAEWIKTKLYSCHAPSMCVCVCVRERVWVCVRERERERESAGAHVCVFCLKLSCRLIGGGCQSQEETCWTALSKLTPRLPPDMACLSAYLCTAVDADTLHCVSIKWHRREAAMCHSIVLFRDLPCEHVFDFTWFTCVSGLTFWPFHKLEIFCFGNVGLIVFKFITRWSFQMETLMMK